jgi:hypothetical protein
MRGPAWRLRRPTPAAAATHLLPAVFTIASGRCDRGCRPESNRPLRRERHRSRPRRTAHMRTCGGVDVRQLSTSPQLSAWPIGSKVRTKCGLRWLVAVPNPRPSKRSRAVTRPRHKGDQHPDGPLTSRRRTDRDRPLSSTIHRIRAIGDTGATRRQQRAAWLLRR